MNVLFLCHRLPYPPSRGGKIRPFNMIRHLAERHHVTVASLARSHEEAEQGRGLEEYCDRVLCDVVPRGTAWRQMICRLPSPLPSSLGYFYSSRLARAVRGALAETGFDLILVHCSSVAQYVEHVQGIPRMLDFGDMDSQKWLEYARIRPFPLSGGYWLEGSKLERLERHLATRFDFCTCTTRAELATLNSYGADTPTGWFPNGVDLDYFRPADTPYDPDRICFIGRMDYFPNQEGMIRFCNDILPRIRARRPATQLIIIGANPSSTIRSLGKRPGITVTGSVPDVRPFVQAAALSVAPLSIARGTQNKVLESLAMGVPVVASEAAAGGIDAIPGEHLLTAPDEEQFAGKILELLEDPARRAELARSGRDRMQSHHDWRRSMQRFDALIEACLQVAGRPREISAAQCG